MGACSIASSVILGMLIGSLSSGGAISLFVNVLDIESIVRVSYPSQNSGSSVVRIEG